MTFSINGVNMAPFVAFGGIKWQRYDIENSDAGRAMNGLMYRGRVATKIKLEVTCKPLKASELMVVLNAILPEYVLVTYDDPMYGRVTKTMYSNNNPATYLIRKPNGEEYWSSISFPLVER